MNSSLYITGTTSKGTKLIGGIWRVYRQHGFPVDLSLLEVREHGALPDVCEMMAEASLHDEPPQQVKQVPELFTDEVKAMFDLMLTLKPPQEILDSKRP